MLHTKVQTSGPCDSNKEDFRIYFYVYYGLNQVTPDAGPSWALGPSFDGWMDDLRFYVLFNSISVISGRCLDDDERLCAMELRLRLRRFHLE